MIPAESFLFSWSGGKDSAMALYELRQKHSCEIAALLTTVTSGYDRISMHGVRRVLLEQQAASLNIPLKIVSITTQATNEEYEKNMKEALLEYKEQGIASVVFGDIFLEDLRAYREQNLAKAGMSAIFPLWNMNTAELTRSFIEKGFRAVITCIDSNVLDKSFAGRMFDQQFLNDLPQGVDPCGENGEFHSFVFQGPLFRNKIEFTPGEVVLRDERFFFQDLIPS
ncbi:MAG: diphthine--ammonia ligase [Bacteroidota bacterium]